MDVTNRNLSSFDAFRVGSEMQTCIKRKQIFLLKESTQLTTEVCSRQHMLCSIQIRTTVYFEYLVFLKQFLAPPDKVTCFTVPHFNKHASSPAEKSVEISNFSNIVFTNDPGIYF